MIKESQESIHSVAGSVAFLAGGGELGAPQHAGDHEAGGRQLGDVHGATDHLASIVEHEAGGLVSGVFLVGDFARFDGSRYYHQLDAVDR